MGNQVSALSKKQKDLANVLRYAKELLVINAKVLADIETLKFPRFYDWQLNGLEGVIFNPGDDVWVSLKRLKEAPPPKPPALLMDWVTPERHPGPDRQPVLLKERVVRMAANAVENLIAAGKLEAADVVTKPVEETEKPTHLDVVQRSVDMPELLEAWNSYLSGPWAQWAESERPRRRSIHVYNQFYHTHQQIVSMGADNPIEMVLGTGIARWQHDDGRINCPLIEQLIETELLEDGTLLLIPRGSDPSINLKPFHAFEVLGSKNLQTEAVELLSRTVKDPDVGFSPFTRSSFERILRLCVSRLSSTGTYLPDEEGHDADRALPVPDQTLRVSDTWVVYVRQRQENSQEQDFERLIEEIGAVESEEELPAAARRFVEPPSRNAGEDGGTTIDLDSNQISLPSGVDDRGRQRENGRVSDGPKDTSEQVYYFPLPYNDDQMEIARLLEDNDGVLVQGPPGTGKTHTIANIICHYLAKGKRVLVTAHAAEALTALQDKIPEDIRGLAISVIHNDREGNAQLERAVRLLSDEIKNIRKEELERDIRDKQARLVEFIQGIRTIDTHLEEIASRNHRKIAFRDQEVSPMELAKAIQAEKGNHDWFGDSINLDKRFEPQFGDTEVSEARALRRALCGDLGYAVRDLPDPACLPDLPQVLSAHRELARINEIDGKTDSGNLPPMASIPDANAMAQMLARWLEEFSDFVESARAEGWILAAYHKFIGVRKATPQAIAALKRGLEQWADLANRGETFAVKAIVAEPPADNVQAFDKSIQDLAQGRKPFGVFSFFKGGLKTALDAVTIEGRQAVEQADWEEVRAYRDWQKAIATFIKQWNAISPVVETSVLADDLRQASLELLRLGGMIRNVILFAAQLDQRRQDIKALFPYGIDINAVLHEGNCALVLESVRLSVERAELASARSLHDYLKQLAKQASTPFHGAVREIASNLGNREVTGKEIGEGWKSVVAEAVRLHGLKESFGRLEALTAKIAGSGAPDWAQRLRTEEPTGGESDPLTPETWKTTWEWARGAAHVRALADRKASQTLSDYRKALEDERRRLFLEVVRLRTFLGLKRRIRPHIEAALAKFVSAINRLGKGTGVTATKFRRLIRESAAEASDAVPCWIMPEWRVSEQLPPTLGAFDLVIIDESSQSDIRALPAIMRAKKALIVGDDKQVSPSPIGIEARKVTQLMLTYLNGLPFAEQMDPATSLYELGGMMFPGKTIMLREHFRCVEPIIRFSSSFYPKPLIPLRIPTASERLDPPLIDIYVPYGQRDGQKRNRAEAELIVDEIEKLVADPTFSKRSIGVISLLGSEQARFIYGMLLEEIGAEAMERHRIMCGDAATFQGQERDIVFLSMVSSLDSVVTQTARLYEQRYNVAMSRARDRLVLVRSLAASHLKRSDLKLKVIEHFRNPMEKGKVVQSDDILSACDSDFERDVGHRLLDLGYRITPQYPISGYRIDFVVEGANDRRLAIELDGDKYHGPERWAHDVARQRSLERMNWRFWRCWGSAWIADPDGCLEDLLGTLKGMGIEALGAAPKGSVYTQHIEASPSQPEKAISEVVAEIPAGMPAGTNLVAFPAAPQENVNATIHPIAANGIKVGDLVTVAYVDTPGKVLRYRLTDGENDLDKGLLSINEPLGCALLGATEEDEVSVSVGSTERQVLVMNVMPRQQELMLA